MSFTIMNIIRQLVAYDSRPDSMDDRIRYCLLPIMGVEPLYPGNKTRFDNPKTGKKETLKWANEDERLDMFRIANRRIEEYNDEIDSYNTVQLFGNEDKMHEVELKEELPLLNTYGFNVSLTGPNNQIPNDLSDEMRIFHRDPKPIYDETLHKTWLDAIDQKCLIDDWISQFNKMIFDHIQRNINEAKKLGSWDEGNIWNRPNKEFINWFHIEGFEQKYIYPLVKESAEPARIAPEGAGRKPDPNKEIREGHVRRLYAIYKSKDVGDQTKSDASRIIHASLQNNKPEDWEGKIYERPTIRNILKKIK